MPDIGSSNRASKTRKMPGVWQVRAMGIGLVLLGLFLAYLFIRLWPAGLDEDTKGSAVQTVHLWRSTITFNVTLDARLILLVMVAGGLGSFIHTATSFGDYVGNDKLSGTWFWWYILRPFIGMTLAVVFYLVIRGGFLSAGTEAGKINPFGIAALAGLVGMFSKQATDKLDEVFNTLFRTEQGHGDSKRRDNLANPVPSISDFEPKSVEPMTNNLIVNVKGAGFVKGAVLRINGTNRDTNFVDESQINAKLLPEDVEKEGELEITIFNPPPGGGESTSMKLKITPNTE